MNYKSKYSEKLRDPRWQRKRLEILQRDNFTCQICFDTKSTLNIHHRRYVSGNEPWEYPDHILVTLCENCHRDEGESIPESMEIITEILKDFYFSSDINCIADALRFLMLSSKHSSEITTKAIAEIFSEPKEVEVLMDKYFEKIKPQKKIAPRKGKK